MLLLQRIGRTSKKGIHRQFKRYFTAEPKLAKIGFGEYCGELFSDGVGATQTILEGIHNYTGIPWWTTIIVAATTIRLFIFPIRIYALRQQSLLQRAHQDVTNKLPEMRSVYRDKAELRQAVGRAWLAAFRSRGTNPLRTLTPLICHIPLFLTFTATLRRMSAFPFWGFTSGMTASGWEYGGMLFFTDLGIVNWPLTAIVFSSNIFTIEWIFRSRSSLDGKRRLLYWIMHGANCFSLVLLSMLPAAINFFVLVNNGLSILEGQLLKSKLVQTLLLERKVHKH